MAPIVPVSLFSRAPSTPGNDDESHGLKPTTIGGIVVACVAAVGVIAWLTVRFFRKRASSKREDKRASAFLNVRGLVKEGAEEKASDAPSSRALNVKGQFSRNQLDNPTIILPQKLRPDASDEEVIQHYTEEGKLPRPFAPFMAGGLEVAADKDKQNKRSSVASFLSASRKSWMSISSSHRFSVASVSTMSVTSSMAGGAVGKRKIRQLFNPILPDELVVSLTEQVTVINSFDDGWCIVGRDGLGGEVEIGAVPAWCFVKPSPGLRGERPLRTSSLGVTINLDEGAGPRQEVMSWSNF